MKLAEKLQQTQKDLAQEGLDGWLFYDFRKTNDLACDFLEIKEKMLTRRFFYWLPKTGEPIKLVNPVEPHVLAHLPGKELVYRSWQHLEESLGKMLRGVKRIAMEYSPRNAIPYVSKVDAGTMEVVRGCGVEVVSSANLLQRFSSVCDEEQAKSHFYAAALLDRVVAGAWQWIGDRLRSEGETTEYEAQEWIAEQIRQGGCVFEGGPFVGVNGNAANPHYCATREHHSSIRKGDFILIDLWCKQDFPWAIYGDITRVGVAASAPTARQQEIFSLVKRARDEATELVHRRFAAREPLMGWEVDAAARRVITEGGYGEYFTHRTGHSIYTKDHGNGAHLDNLETQDRRRLLPGTCFSIEPGIYLPGELGIRLEYDIFVDLEGKVHLTGGIQQEIFCIL